MSIKTAVALGLFDGIHTGHRLILSKALAYPEYKPAVFTFNTESVKFKHGKDFEYIYPNSRKLDIIRSMGIDYIESPDFGELRNMDGEEFVRKILIEKMNAGIVVCGENFRFGKDASYNADNLYNLGKKYNFKTEIIKLAEKSGNAPISSAFIRKLLKQGDISSLSELGFNYAIKNTVVQGNKIGRTIDFPTINQHFGECQLVPRKGVYETTSIINNLPYKSITNIGVKPTVENNINPLAETHIINYSGDLYGKNIEVIFRRFIRDEKKFQSVEKLREQISIDINSVLKLN